MEEFLPILIIIALIINGLGLIFFALSFRQQSSDYVYERPKKPKKEEVTFITREEFEEEETKEDEEYIEDYKQYFKNGDDDDDEDYRFNKYNEIEDDRPGSPKNRDLLQVDLNNMDLHNYEGGEDDYNREDEGIEIHDLKKRSSKFEDTDYENMSIYKELKEYEKEPDKEEEEDLGSKYQINFHEDEEENEEEEIPVVQPQKNRQLLNTTSLLNQEVSDEDEEEEEDENEEEERLIIKQFEPLKYKDRDEFHQEEQEEFSENEIEKRIEFLAGNLDAPLKPNKTPKKRTDF